MITRPARVAIVSDPLVQRGGAERCVEALAEAFPDAPVFAILYSPERGPASIADRVIPSFLQRIPNAAHRHRAFLPLYPAAVESFDLSEYDIIISSHHTVAKGLLRRSDQMHLCYCHTPMRALWVRPHDELEKLPAVARPFAAALTGRMRVWDYVTAARVDQFIANSSTTQSRIAKHYGRESIIVPPPIDVERFTPAGEASDYYLIASRNVPYKRLDIAVAATGLLGRRLVIVGTAGDDESADAAHVDRRGHVSDEQLVDLMRGARALLFPQYEDFGMTPVEMMACGRPVVAFAAGGALDTVVDGVTGILVPEQTPQAFASAMLRLEQTMFSPDRLRRHALGFSKARFVSTMRSMVESAQDETAPRISAASSPR